MEGGDNETHFIIENIWFFYDYKKAMKYFLKFLLIFTICFASLGNAATELKNGSIIRDAEIEAVLKSYIHPIFKVAKIDPDSMNLYIISTPDINAAATFNSTLMINTGFLMCCDRPEEIVGVLAHETGHLAGGHIVRRIGAMEKSFKTIMAGMLLGAAAVIAGAPEVGVGLMMAGQSVSMGAFLHYTRGQESAADQAGVKFLEALGWTSKGCLEFMEKIKSFELAGSVPDYMRTHPPTSDRIEFLRAHCQNSQYSHMRLPEKFYADFERMKAKIKAFSDPPYATLLNYPQSDRSIKARYARAIAYYRKGDLEAALRLNNQLIAEYPKDPYFQELKGQILFENGDVTKAIDAYRQAIEKAPNAPLIRVSYAQALIESNRKAAFYEAIQELLKAKATENEMPFLWRLFAIAYGKTNQMNLSALALAEEAMLTGQHQNAITQAKRAQHLGLKGPQLIRASDIIAFAEQEIKNMDKSVL